MHKEQPQRSNLYQSSATPRNLFCGTEETELELAKTFSACRSAGAGSSHPFINSDELQPVGRKGFTKKGGLLEIRLISIHALPVRQRTRALVDVKAELHHMITK